MPCATLPMVLQVIGATITQSAQSQSARCEARTRITSYNVCYTKLLRKTRQRPYRHIGEIVESFSPAGGPGCENAGYGTCFDDDKKLALVRAEPRIKLLLEQRVNAVECRDGRIVSVVAQHIRTSSRVRLAGALFVDCRITSYNVCYTKLLRNARPMISAEAGK